MKTIFIQSLVVALERLILLILPAFIPFTFANADVVRTISPGEIIKFHANDRPRYEIYIGCNFDSESHTKFFSYATTEALEYFADRYLPNRNIKESLVFNVPDTSKEIYPLVGVINIRNIEATLTLNFKGESYMFSCSQ